MSAPFYPETNSIIARNTRLFDLVAREDLPQILLELGYNWTGGPLNPDARILPLFEAHNLASRREGNWYLTRMGTLFLGRLLLHFSPDREQTFGSLREKYSDFSIIAAGKNSVVGRARHSLLGTNVILKLVRPGASTNITQSIRRLASLPADSGVVLPIDFMKVSTADILGKPVLIDCLVFPLIEGITFRQFLTQTNHHLNSQVVMSFAKQVGRALKELESVGAYHGDLHEANILVDQYSNANSIQFRIVDISFDAMGSLPFEECRNNDLSNFKQHVWRILSIQKSFMPGMSLRKYIGTQNYQRIMRVLSPATLSFASVCEALGSEAEYQNYLKEKVAFIDAHFKRPVSFRLQRYEEITDQAVAVKLFVPFEQLMEKITAFGNMYVSGNRGSGKSTYLASLAFFPSAEEAVVDFADVFGVYFPCRQGEFRPLLRREDWSERYNQKTVTHVVVIKIIRRTLESIAEGIRRGRIASPANLQQLRDFINRFVPPPGIISVDHDIQSEMENFVATMIRVEVDEIRALAETRKLRGNEREGRCLLEFFDIVRETCKELGAARFHLLFDDAGLPYVPTNVQHVLNDLILTSNALFCVKLSAEKLTFEFQNSEGKVLESGQDYFEHDISQILFIGTGSGGINRAVLERYFRKIVEKRLDHFSFATTDIEAYLGDEMIDMNKLLFLLAASRKDAYYCGWTTVWNIADRTPRNLLEIVSEIFAVGNIEPSTKPRMVSMRDQDLAIRTISEKRLESLSQVPGSIVVFGKRVSLGRHLFETTAAIGSVFRKYLKSEPVRRGRKRQHLAIERNDLQELLPEAEHVLRKLVTFGVLDASRAAYARNDEIKKPFFVLNRIYCPAFGIGFRRDEHLRLSNRKMEQLLLDPQQFVRDGTRRLRTDGESTVDDLFGYGSDYGRE